MEGTSIEYKHIIIYLCNVVLENLARSYENVVKGVQEFMGGKVIETEAKKILNDGIRKGIIEGKREESVNTERERHRADAAEQKISMLQKELDALKQQLSDLMQAQELKPAEV